MSFMTKAKGTRVAATPNANAPVGSGGRFAALEQKFAADPKVRNPAALAAFEGRKKYGAGKFNKMAQDGE